MKTKIIVCSLLFSNLVIAATATTSTATKTAVYEEPIMLEPTKFEATLDYSKLTYDSSTQTVLSSGSTLTVDETKYDLIATQEAVAVIDKTSPIKIDAIQAESVPVISNLLNNGELVLPVKPGRGLFALLKGQYTMNNYINYLLSLSDTELYDALRSGLVGQCRMLRRQYFSETIKAKMACDYAIYMPLAQAVAGKAFSQKIKCMPGATLLSGKKLQCLDGYPGGVCMKPSMELRTAAFIRHRLKKTLTNSSFDPCGINKVVENLNNTQLGKVDVNSMASNQNIIFSKASSGQTLCFYKITADVAKYYPANLVATIEGQKAIALRPDTCQFAEYRALRKAVDPNSNTIPDIPNPVVATAEQEQVVNTTLTSTAVNLDMLVAHQHKIIEAEMASLPMTEADLTNSYGQVSLEEVKFDGEVKVYKSITEEPIKVYEPISSSTATKTAM